MAVTPLMLSLLFQTAPVDADMFLSAHRSCAEKDRSTVFMSIMGIGRGHSPPHALIADAI